MSNSQSQEWMIRDVMTKQVTTVSTEDIVTKVNQIFGEEKIHHLPVINLEEEIAGIISRIDLHAASAGYSVFKQHRQEQHNQALYRSLRAVDIMTANPRVIAPDAPLIEAIEIFKDNVFRALPVAKDKKIVGIITPYDIMIHYSRNCKK